MNNPKQLQTIDEFFSLFKDVIKASTSSCFELKEFRNFSASNANKTRLTQFLNRNTKASVLDEGYVETKLKEWLKDKEYRDTFIFHKSVVRYNYMPKLTNERDLVELIDKSPQGLYLSEDLMKYTYPQIRLNVKDLIKRRECIPIRSKNAEKNKLKDENYEGCYLFSVPIEIRSIPNLHAFFKKTPEEMENLNDQEKKLETKYETKTAPYRSMYEQICAENVNKQNLNMEEVSAEGKKIVELADQINRRAIPQLQQILQKKAKQKK